MAAGDVITPLNTVTTAGSSVNTSTVTSTTPVAASTVVGLTFVAPVSGTIRYDASFIINSSVAAGNGAAGVFIRTGSTIGSGTTVQDPSVEPAAKLAQNGYVGALAGSICDVITGLTAGATYNAVCVHWSSSGTVQFFQQKLTITTM